MDTRNSGMPSEQQQFLTAKDFEMRMTKVESRLDKWDASLTLLHGRVRSIFWGILLLAAVIGVAVATVKLSVPG